ncbi:hypothetical protein [Flavobacterium sp. W20_MBD1_R3]|uniref:hypothetical protein n=1 Tax=Flavobacterium sp. W20_MBD1_R3 TaxID=3240278 RepID=UPI003F8F3D26
MNTKIKIQLITAVLVVSTASFGQVRIGRSINNTVASSSSAFIDASSNSSNNLSTNIGKGLIYPRMDLTTFASFSGSPVGIGTSYPSRFDGMIVYNIGTGNTLATAADAIIAVTPGFWYYDNKSTAVKGGTWKSLGSTSSTSVKNIASTETVTLTSIDGKQVYALTGTFTAVGTAATVTVATPTGMTGYYKMTTFQGGKTFREGITSFSIDPLVTADNVVTGNGMYNEVYPAGVYSYTLEYFK